MRSATSFIVVALVALAGAPAAAQIRVNPTGVNLNGQGPTTAFLTFGPLGGYVPLESLWCGSLLPAVPDVGLRCNPATLFGSLPARYDQSSLARQDSFTDIMSVPESVARRAYDAASAGDGAEFFYVRHFVRPGSPDQFVAVTCRLTAGGARVPLSLVDVRLAWNGDAPVLTIDAGSVLPRVWADLVYTGTGRLQGRWEVVLPGQELPTSHDLLTEATLAPNRRGTQRRYVEIERFNVFLAPTGRYRLPGPDPSKLPSGIDGQYVILLRIEVSDDKEADSDPGAIGVGGGVVHAGGVSGFPMPTLRYVVAGGAEVSHVSKGSMESTLPSDGATFAAGEPIDLSWSRATESLYYRVELESGGKLVHQALVSSDTYTYRLPPFVFDRLVGGALRWRIVAMDGSGRDGAASSWRGLSARQD